jgi:hypothetical protein
MKLLLYTLSISHILLRYIPIENSETKVVMIISLLRHGARTPSKLRPEFLTYFSSTQTGKLTLNGFRQMILLGKVHRSEYFENTHHMFKDFINKNKIKEQFLLISSPYQRAVESGIGYVTGLLPELLFKIHDVNNLIDNEENILPPIINTKDNNETSTYTNNLFNIIVESSHRDVIFHSRKCLFPETVYKNNEDKHINDKQFNYLTTDEKKIVYEFYKDHFNITLKEIDFEEFTDKLARSLYTAVRCINANYNSGDKIKIPGNVEKILKKLFAYYLFIIRTDNDEITKITSSPFLDHILNFFDHKISNSENKLEFYELGKFNYTDLKLVTYSGHDYNFVGLIKNLLNIQTILEYIENIDIYHKFLIIPFASNLDFHLIKSSGDYYVKIFLNGEEIFERLRSYKQGEEIIYEKNRGIPYKIFKKILQSRIFKNYHKCLATKK